MRYSIVISTVTASIRTMPSGVRGRGSSRDRDRKDVLRAGKAVSVTAAPWTSACLPRKRLNPESSEDGGAARKQPTPRPRIAPSSSTTPSRAVASISRPAIRSK